MAHYAAFHLGLHCFQKYQCGDSFEHQRHMFKLMVKKIIKILGPKILLYIWTLCLFFRAFDVHKRKMLSCNLFSYFSTKAYVVGRAAMLTHVNSTVSCFCINVYKIDLPSTQTLAHDQRRGLLKYCRINKKREKSTLSVSFHVIFS